MRTPLAIAVVVALLLGAAFAGIAAWRPVEAAGGDLRPITVQAPRLPAPPVPDPAPDVVAPPPVLDDDGPDDDGPDDGPDDDGPDDDD